jgi:hypothetical protein
MTVTIPCFGRLPRTFDPQIPHYSALRMRLGILPPPPISRDWTLGVNPNWGTMKNDTLGICAEAAGYHAMQNWSVLGRSVELTEPDAKVEQAYTEITGYDPGATQPDGTNPTDQGTNLQDMLTKWYNTGLPISEGPNGRSKLRAFVEVDPRNHDDVRRVIDEGGGILTGTNIPAYLVTGRPMPMLWDILKSGNKSSVGGHAIWTPKYDANQLGFVSWGSGAYAMTWDFWEEEVDECYGLIHPWWIASTGKTILGMSEADLDAAMAAMKKAA